VLFETYHRATQVDATARAIWRTFLPLVLGVLVLLWLVQLPLAWRMATRLARGRREREALLAHAVEASDAERSRIAADLHDGPVQDLAGLSFALEAAAGRAAGGEAPSLAPALRDAAGRTRQSMRALRSLLVEIHPPNLASVGLEAALGDLLAPLAARGLETELVVDGPPGSDEAEALLYRAAQEAVRNVVAHAGATQLRVRVWREDGEARLAVEDDGRGMDDGARERAREAGHLGLSLIEDLVARAGGRMSVHTGTEGGTVVEVAIPCP
jgi:signal transduction histidine kinase